MASENSVLFPIRVAEHSPPENWVKWCCNVPEYFLLLPICMRRRRHTKVMKTIFQQFSVLELPKAAKKIASILCRPTKKKGKMMKETV